MEEKNHKFEFNLFDIGCFASEQSDLAYEVRGIRTELERRKRNALAKGERYYDRHQNFHIENIHENDNVERVNLETVIAEKQAQIMQFTKAKLTAIRDARAKGLLKNGIAPYGTEIEPTTRPREFKLGRDTAFNFAMKNLGRELDMRAEMDNLDTDFDDIDVMTNDL